MVVYVLYRSYLINHMPETEILGVFSKEDDCISARHVYITDNWEYVEPNDIAYHEASVEI